MSQDSLSDTVAEVALQLITIAWPVVPDEVSLAGLVLDMSLMGDNTFTNKLEQFPLHGAAESCSVLLLFSGILLGKCRTASKEPIFVDSSNCCADEESHEEVAVESQVGHVGRAFGVGPLSPQ